MPANLHEHGFSADVRLRSPGAETIDGSLGMSPSGGR